MWDGWAAGSERYGIDGVIFGGAALAAPRRLRGYWR